MQLGFYLQLHDASCFSLEHHLSGWSGSLLVSRPYLLDTTFDVGQIPKSQTFVFVECE